MIKRYPWQLLPRLALSIELGRINAAHQLLDSLLHIIEVTCGADLELRKLRSAQVVNLCLRGAHAGGAQSGWLLDRNMEILKGLMRLRAWAAIRRYLHRHVDHLMKGVRTDTRNRMEKAIIAIRRDMLSAGGMSRMLSDHASVHGVSEAYLSREFTRIVGHSFRTELRRVRTEAACRLLTSTSWKLNAIAAQIGMGDASQFIANFRADIGVTPNVYRSRQNDRSPVRAHRQPRRIRPKTA